MKPLIVLGSTGSIGTQTLSLAQNWQLEVSALAAFRPSTEFMTQAQSFPDACLALGSTPDREERSQYETAMGRPVRWGMEAVVALAANPDRIVVNGMVGAVGLEPTLAALGAGNRLCLANKESLVIGGQLVMKAVQDGGGEIIPVDSEHSGLWQLLSGCEPDHVSRLILTASGGPFLDLQSHQLPNVTPEQALAHPTWSMGARINVDSATMANKGMEVIEAHHLFGVEYGRIDTLIHPQSVVHALVELTDGSLLAQLGPTDMSLPIGLAIGYPQRRNSLRNQNAWSLSDQNLEFRPVDTDRFPMLDLAYRAGRSEASAAVVYNAADELAVAAFLERKIGFSDIARLTELALDIHEPAPIAKVSDIWEFDRNTRSFLSNHIDNS